MFIQQEAARKREWLAGQSGEGVSPEALKER